MKLKPAFTEEKNKSLKNDIAYRVISRGRAGIV